MSFLIAKQPIFNKEGKRVAFEVFLRKKENMYDYPKEVPYSRATYIVVEMLLEQGIDRIGEGKKVMINVSLDSIINKAIDALDLKKLIIDIIEPQIPLGEVVYKHILDRIDKYIERGVTFSINESYLNNTKLARLLDKVSIISVDVKRLNESIVEFARRNSKTLLVSRIESEEEFNKAKEVGNYFQGNYLETPFILKELRSAPYLKHTLLKIMAIIHSAQSTKEIANIISTDVGMSAKILRLVNSAYYSPIKEIKSVEQACALLGLKNLKNFLLLLAMNDYVSIENPELWKKSLIRALIAQRIAELIYPQYESEAYLMGLFSLIDEILGVDKIAFLKDINVGQEIIDGYTGKNAQLRSILDCSIILEEKLPEFLNMQGFIQNDIIANLEKLIGLSGQTLIDIAKSAFELADQILKI